MLVGIVWQVVSLLIFLYLTGEIYMSITRSDESARNPDTASLRNSRKFQGFLWAWAIATLAIFARCVYRIAELAKGWHSPIMMEEWSFIAFDGW